MCFELSGRDGSYLGLEAGWRESHSSGQAAPLPRQLPFAVVLTALLISIRRWLILFYISRQLFHLYYHSGPSVSLSYVRKEMYTFLYLIKIA